MTSLWRRALIYLGLADDEEYEYDYGDEYEEPTPRANRHQAPPTAPRAGDYGPAVRTLRVEEQGSSTLPPPQRPAAFRTQQVAPKVHVVEPKSFNDAQEVADRLKVTQPVILNLQGLDRELQRRLIDFGSGVTYALGGSMSRVHDEVFLLTPANVEVSQEEKERLEARGLYRQ